METEKIINFWKEIIYIAWFYKKYKPEEKQKIENKLTFYKEKLTWSENIYSKRILSFIEDLLWDLALNRELRIDNIFEDDFVWNYYSSIKILKIYNYLIDFDNYKNIFENKKIEENNLFFEKFFKNFEDNFKKLEIKTISNLLLIFTIFDLISPKKYLKRLFDFRKNIWLSFENIQKLKYMIKSYEDFLNNIYKVSLINLKNKNFAYKYIKIEKIWEENNFKLKFILQDASKDKFRSGNPIYEYKEVLKNLKKY